MATAKEIYMSLLDGDFIEIRLEDRKEADSLRVALYRIRAAFNAQATMFDQLEDTRIISMTRVSSDVWRYQFTDASLRPKKSYEIVKGPTPNAA